MRDKPENSNKRTNQFMNGMIIIGLTTLLFLILVGVFGNAGNYVKNFFVGTFGYAIYGYTIALFFVGILNCFGWSCNAKLGVKLAFGALVAIVIAMCHIGVSRELSVLNYVDYLKQCYLTHSTAGGILGGVIFYPLAKGFVFSMVFLSLFLIGDLALLIVMHINYELVISSRTNKVKVFGKEKKIKKVDNNVYEAELDQNHEQDEDSSHVLYNGTVEGKNLADGFSRTHGAPGLSEYVPLEESNYSFEDYDDLNNENYLDQDDSLENNNTTNVSGLNSTQQEAIKILYDNSDIQYGLPTRKSVDVSNTLNQLKKNKKVDNKNNSIKDENDEVKQNKDSNVEKSPYAVDDRYKQYTNNYRKNQMFEHMGLTNSEEEVPSEDIDKNTADDFMQDIENSINSALKDNFVENNKTEDVEDIVEQTEEVVDNTIVDEIPKDESVEIENKSVINQVNLDDIDAPRKESEYKLSEEEVRQQRLAQLRAKYSHKIPGTNCESYENNKQAMETKSSVPIVDNKPSIKTKVVENKVEEKEKVKRVIKPYNYPSIDILNDYNQEGFYDEEEMQKKCRTFEEKMESFAIDVKVERVVKGPTFSRIEFSTNTTLNKIIAKTNDMAMWLEVESMRLEAPIPGKNLCGIEIPNKKRGIVGLKELIMSDDFKDKEVNEGLYFALGQDIDGKNYISNLASFPHALIAGGTGSGKSVCLNCMICSLLYKYTPEQLRFIMVDPKIIELSKYKGIPHMLIPEILYEEKKVIKALKWLNEEMERRYELLDKECVSKLSQYNEEVEESERLPEIVTIIDEVGDIILSPVGKDFEQLVKKLTQKARAAGIYLILATQRPSVDVITGTIKTNLPTRIAMAVAQGVDSKTIIDTVGAEKLLGNGDMLYKENGKPNIVRLQGAYIGTKEIKRLVEQVKSNNDVYYNDDAFESINKEEEQEETEVSEKQIHESKFQDALCPDVLRFALTCRDLSISRLQRKFSLGFNRAAKLHDWLVEEGYLVEGENKKKSFILTEEEVERIIESGNNNE